MDFTRLPKPDYLSKGIVGNESNDELSQGGSGGTRCIEVLSLIHI